MQILTNVWLAGLVQTAGKFAAAYIAGAAVCFVLILALSRLGIGPLAPRRNRQGTSWNVGPQASAFLSIRAATRPGGAQEELLVVGYGDGWIRVFDRGGGRLLAGFRAAREWGQVTNLAYCSRSGLIAAGLGLKEVRVYRLSALFGREGASPAPLHHIRQEWSSVSALIFSPDGHSLAVGMQDGGIDVYRMGAKAERAASLSGHRGEVLSLAFHPTQPNVLASGGIDRTVRIWNTAAPREARTIHASERPTDAVRSLRFTPDGQALAFAGQDSVRFHGRGVWQAREALSHPGVRTISFGGPQGEILALAGDRGDLLWDLVRGVPQPLDGPGSAYLELVENGLAVVRVRPDGTAQQAPLSDSVARGHSAGRAPEAVDVADPLICRDEEAVDRGVLPAVPESPPRPRERLRAPLRLAPELRAGLKAAAMLGLIPALVAALVPGRAGRDAAAVRAAGPARAADPALTDYVQKARAIARKALNPALPKSEARRIWLRAAAAADLVSAEDHPEWIRAADNEAIAPRHAGESRPHLDAVAEARVIQAAACSRLGEKRPAAAAAKAVVGTYRQARLKDWITGREVAATAFLRTRFPGAYQLAVPRASESASRAAARARPRSAQPPPKRSSAPKRN